MGIHLDWKVEDDTDQEIITEDPESIAARQRRLRLLRNIFIALVLIVGAATALAVNRLRKVEERLEANLRDTVAAEVLALRIGDGQVFLQAQASIEGWRAIQQGTFAEYQALGTRLVANGEIVDLEIEADQARVVIREYLDGEPYLVTWFYHHDDTGWYHIPSRPEFWGKEELRRSNTINLIHNEVDRKLAIALTHQTTAWLSGLCDLEICAEPLRRFTVIIETDQMAESGWAQDGSLTLVIRSPHLGRIPEGRGPESMIYADLHALMIDNWFEIARGGSPPGEPWLEAELDDWVAHQFDNTRPPSHFFSTLEVIYGPDLVPDFLDRYDSSSSESLRSILRGMLDDALTADPASPDPDADLLTDRLNAALYIEAQLVADGYWEQADLLFSDPMLTDRSIRQAPYPIEIEPVIEWAAPGSIDVINVQQVGDLAWVGIRFRQADPGLFFTGDYIYSLQPFRLVDGHWYRTQAASQDWGLPLQTSDGRITVSYRWLDEPYIRTVIEILDAYYTRIADDFGVEERPPLQVFISPSEAERISLSSDLYRDPPQDRLNLVLPSPYLLAAYYGHSPAEAALRRMAGQQLITEILAYQAQSRQVNQTVEAITRREATKLGIYDDQFYYKYKALQREPADLLVLGLMFDSIWLGRENNTAYAYALQNAADVLINLLVEQYGEESLPLLITNLNSAQNVDQWLWASLEIHEADIEEAWLDRVQEILESLD